jgi:hypothetical protein
MLGGGDLSASASGSPNSFSPIAFIARRNLSILPGSGDESQNWWHPRFLQTLNVNGDVRSAVSMSHLRELPSELLDELMADAVRVKIPAGSVTHNVM